MDDILDVTGSDEELGKPHGSDERHGKVTYVSLFGLERARELAAESHAKAREALERRCRGVASANNCELKWTWVPGYPSTVNDPAMADYVATIARKTLGPDRFIPVARPSMGGEDFAYYLDKVPGCFFLVGVAPAVSTPAVSNPPDRNDYPSLHSDRYDFTDAAMAVGMRMFVELVRNFHVD